MGFNCAISGFVNVYNLKLNYQALVYLEEFDLLSIFLQSFGCLADLVFMLVGLLMGVANEMGSEHGKHFQNELLNCCRGLHLL